MLRGYITSLQARESVVNLPWEKKSSSFMTFEHSRHSVCIENIRVVSCTSLYRCFVFIWHQLIFLEIITKNVHMELNSNHGMFLEWWNRTKSLSSIWQYFSCQLDEGIPKIWKKLNSHDGFLSCLQNSTANSAHLAAHFCPALVCPQNATVTIQFLPYFWNPHIK